MEIDGAIRLLGYTSPYTMAVWPRNGNGLYLYDGSWQHTAIAGQVYDIRDITIDGIAHQSSLPGWNYYLYAYRLNGVAYPDASTTPPTTDGATGFQVKTGDITRRLIGGFHHIAGMGLGSGANFYTTGSWFHRLSINVARLNIAGYTVNPEWTKINGFADRVYAWAWGDGTEHTPSFSGTFTNNVVGKCAYVGLSIDDQPPVAWQKFSPAFVGQPSPFGMTVPHLAVAGGLHSYDLVMKTDPGGLAGLVDSNAVLTVKVND